MSGRSPTARITTPAPTRRRKGKKLYVFANAYSDIPSQFMNALRDAEACAKGADVRPGLYNKDIKKLCAWMKENGY